MIRIVPNKDDATQCSGVRIETETGEQVCGIRKLVLIAEPGGQWNARIEADVEIAGPILAKLVEVRE